MKRRIILASASPRRRELMNQIGIACEIMPSDKEEAITEKDPEKVSLREASLKARDIALKAAEKYPEEPCFIIGADTVVASDGCVLGKPENEADAAGMLRRLSGKIHQVYTGVCVIRLPEKQEVSFSEKTEVEVSTLTENEIKDYLETGEPFDKAGAYGIQGYFARYVVGISGDYHNVVGLPVGRLYRECLAGEI